MKTPAHFASCQFEAAAQAGGLEILKFKIPGMRLCAPLENIIKVLPLMELQPVPGGPRYLRGLMNLHGRSIPVIDLAARLGYGGYTRCTLETPILLCEHEGLQTGLIVEKVIGVEALERDAWQQTPAFDNAGLLLNGTVQTLFGPSQVLCMERVIAIDPGGTHHPVAPADGDIEESA
jgi:chemotaxis signal transduction protein